MPEDGEGDIFYTQVAEARGTSMRELSDAVS